MKEDIQVIKKFMEKLESRRQNWNNVWQDINDYMLPFKQDIYFSDVPGQQRNEYIYDSTATHSILRLAASLGSLLTNPASEWLGLETQVDELNMQDDVQEYLYQTSKIILKSLENSNFYTEVNRMYIDLVSYGTGILYIEPSKKPGRDLRFSARGVNETYISENAEGIIDTVFRKFEMTVRQVVDEFGIENVSDKVKKMWEKSPEEYVKVSHAVFPRDDFDYGKKDSKNKRYASIWYECEANDSILKKGGYDTFPYVVARWLKETGEVYGRSPAMNALPDVKTLNLMVSTLLKTGQKIADPLLMVPDDAFADVTGEPGQIIAYDPTSNARIEALNIGSNLPFTFEMTAERRKVVEDYFYTNQMIIPTGNRERVTAEEIRARQTENARILGPTFGTLNYEFLTPLIERVYDILLGVVLPNGNTLIPQEPDGLSAANAKLKFLSPLAKSQRSHELQSIQYTIGVVSEWAQFYPPVLDNFDWDRSARVVADISGAPAVTLKPMEEVMAEREQRAQQAAQERQMMLEQQQAQTAETGSRAAKNINDIEQGE